MLHYTIPLSKETTEATRNPLSLASTVPDRRLELRLGKMSTVDFFDLNSVGSDSHLQFMNWAIVNNGAFDYAADTRGYTYGLVAEYYAKAWAARFGEMLMPTVANGITLDWNIARARGENFEFEFHPALLPQARERGARARVRQSRQYGQLSGSHRRLSVRQGRCSRHHRVPQAGEREIRFRLECRAGTDSVVAGLRATGMERRPQRIVRLYRNRPHGGSREPIFAASHGTARSTKSAQPSSRTESRAITGAIWPWEAGIHPGRRRR